ncbi:hypothetical protein J2T55_000335 [Methylohalomonas lacus]|uniref:DUF1329 domain-containing protein n=1 Tax=Methylohalomonas lacus TaxID=398773 RepID=A0AAE3HJS0_9GAMM|nr:DUF1329 domain-containing protein [Methylohalomonas lacus]MCS3902339.1 hypothetical protein [Methylohalomonas lacus]
MRRRFYSESILLAMLLLGVGAPLAADDTKLQQLGDELTPLGGERAGSADGRIPEWRGGITEPPADYRPGEHYVDPYADETPRLTITADNMDAHADQLTAGHKALLRQYPDSYFMPVYPSHRSASVPARIAEATRAIAGQTQLTADGNGVEDAAVGIPFPIPDSGLEVIWNHMLRYRGDYIDRRIIQAAPTRSGDYSLVEFRDRFSMNYSLAETTVDNLDNILLYFKQEVLAPARLSGSILLVHETLNQNRENRQAWIYNPGQRRVRRAPSVAFDNPGTASDGMRTNDQLDMFNGSPERYNWELKGKREMIVPYNNYRLQSPELSYADILTPRHINQAHTRYELHRVWVVEATLKEGARHIYKRRTFYIDEDSWQILAVDQYDNRDELWRVSEAFAMNFYDVPMTWSALDVHTDLQSGRYLAIGLYNEGQPYDFDVEFDAYEFTPNALRRDGMR